MKDGDVYDCIDVNEQPAFNHPLLKDHKIQMKPSYFPVWTDMETLLSDSYSQVQPSSIECPTGTVPIMRTNISGSIPTHSINVFSNDWQWESAGLKYTGDAYGTRAILNVWEPKVNKRSQDYSALWLQMENGGALQTDRIGAGLRVSPSLSGDTFVRLHIAWYDGYSRKSCVDFSCPGFVQVHRHIGPGSRIERTSIYGGQQRIVGVQIFKDPISKYWWVSYNKIPIGYWPSGLFEFLRDKGAIAFWGGVVEGPTAQSNSPQMGSGHFASEGFGKAAYISNIEIADDKASAGDFHLSFAKIHFTLLGHLAFLPPQLPLPPLQLGDPLLAPPLQELLQRPLQHPRRPAAVARLAISVILVSVTLLVFVFLEFCFVAASPRTPSISTQAGEPLSEEMSLFASD
ncbi:hypothetical protein D1007_17223 [Hordeum vulgare]|nr:hypothetical protein D1007_17223 [Hordeum vulgare]